MDRRTPIHSRVKGWFNLFNLPAHYYCLLIIGTTLLTVSACSDGTTPAIGVASPPAQLMTPTDLQVLPKREPDHRIAYGEEVDQYGELRVPPQGGPQLVGLLPFAEPNKLGLSPFDLDELLSAAHVLKYTKVLKQDISEQWRAPADDF